MECLTVKDIQQCLGVSKGTAYKLMHSGAFPVLEVGRVYRIPKDLFEVWVMQEASTKTV